MTRHRWWVVPMLTALCGLAFAQSAPPATDDIPIRDMETMVVSGVQPGPGLWKVRKGDHTLWVLGTISPLPRRMEWESRDVELVIAQAQEVIGPPGLVVDADIGFFSGLRLMPKMLTARRSPDGKTLQELVPPQDYARWLALKQRYIGNDGGVEKWRPMFAAMELYEKAIEKSGMRLRGVIGPVLDRAMKKHDVPEVSPQLKVMIQDPKDALNEFRASQLDDLDCFEKTLSRLETDLDTMRQRANAWAIGDIEALRGLPYSDQNEACMRAAAQSAVIRKRAGDIEGQVAQHWLDAAEKALAKNAVTFATLPMREILKPDGYLAQLQARGYEVEAP